MKPLSERLKQIRLQRQLTLHELHMLTGFSISTLERWEKGMVTPSSQSMARLIKFYDTPELLSVGISTQKLLMKLSILEKRIEKLERRIGPG